MIQVCYVNKYLMYCVMLRSLHSTLFPSEAYIKEREYGLHILLVIDSFRCDVFFFLSLRFCALRVMCDFSFLFVLFSPYMC
jgi:hypothetical protein